MFSEETSDEPADGTVGMEISTVYWTLFSQSMQESDEKEVER